MLFFVSRVCVVFISSSHWGVICHLASTLLMYLLTWPRKGVVAKWNGFPRDRRVGAIWFDLKWWIALKIIKYVARSLTVCNHRNLSSALPLPKENGALITNNGLIGFSWQLWNELPGGTAHFRGARSFYQTLITVTFSTFEYSLLFIHVLMNNQASLWIELVDEWKHPPGPPTHTAWANPRDVFNYDSTRLQWYCCYWIQI